MTFTWVHEEQPRWDADKKQLFGQLPPGVFSMGHSDGEELLEEWWSVRDDAGTLLGYGWMDSTWGGDVEILVAVHPAARDKGVGSFVLEMLEQEASRRGSNYVYNVVLATNPEHDRLHDWLSIRGYTGSDSDKALRKRVHPPDTAPAASAAVADRSPAGASRRPTDIAPAPPAPAYVTAGASSPSAPQPGRGPGHEESGGYVDVEDHRY